MSLEARIVMRINNLLNRLKDNDYLREENIDKIVLYTTLMYPEKSYKEIKAEIEKQCPSTGC